MMLPRTRQLATEQAEVLINTAFLTKKISQKTADTLRAGVETALDQDGDEFPYLHLNRKGDVTVEWERLNQQVYADMDME